MDVARVMALAAGQTVDETRLGRDADNIITMETNIARVWIHFVIGQSVGKIPKP